MSSADFRARARAALQGRWGLVIIVTLIAVILGAGGSNVDLNIREGHSFFEQPEFSFRSGIASVFLLWKSIIAIAGTFVLLYSIAVFVLGGAVELGLNRFNIKLLKNEPDAGLHDLFSYFSYLGRAFMLRLLMWLFIALWSLLLIVPGIIAAIRYSMAPYILAQNPQMSALEAIDASKRLMDGKKMDLFLLGLSFIGWIILAALTLGIGFLWLDPYMNAAYTAFYLYHTNQLPGIGYVNGGQDNESTDTGDREYL
jgi:uncharacterized membrane protein